MDSTMVFLTVFFGVLLRIGLPVALTVILVALLRRLDARWQQEGAVAAPIKAANTRCWETHGCSPENRAACPAYAHPETPCWQLFRSKDGLLREKCLGCQVFQKAPAPVTS
jgi:hypothetical protein